MTAKATPWNFVKAFGADWAERMSGPISVPLMISALFIPDLHFAIGTALLGVGCGGFASYRVWAAERNHVNELEKIGRSDLERMLNGRFLGNTFMLGGEINLCKKYKGTLTLNQLCADFDRVEARAPGTSIASIRFKLNAHREWSGHFHVLVRDGSGNVRRVDNIYEPFPVLLGNSGEFYVKLVRDETVQFEDGSEFWVDLNSWRK